MEPGLDQEKIVGARRDDRRGDQPPGGLEPLVEDRPGGSGDHRHAVDHGGFVDPGTADVDADTGVDRIGDHRRGQAHQRAP
jgi:hypothetical protein